MALIVSTTIEGDPVSKERPRKGRRGQVYTPDKTKRAEDAIAWQILATHRSLRPSAGDFAVHLWFFLSDRRRRDVDNLVKVVLDGCNKIVWNDDSQVVELSARVERGCAKPRTVLLIMEKP